ncbi:MAG: hypothetical protein EBR82_68680 [Caulobacteraceae bacterium]|nr:hypothetical protein [Caulobacteraceae bacterium]
MHSPVKRTRTARGFQVVTLRDVDNVYYTLQQSSAIDDTDFGQSKPGSSFLWFDTDDKRIHLDRERVKGLVHILQKWLEDGTFDS